MKTDEAARLINQATWRPGMEVRATAEYPFDLIGAILVEIVLDTFDSSYPDADGRYRVRRKIAPQGMLSVLMLDEEGVLHAVLKMVGQAQEHEDREFLRVKRNGQWVAPFHPHNDDTEAAWAALEGKSREKIR